jgi:hypothetical protein
MAKAMRGLAMIQIATFCTLAQPIASAPPADRPAPTRPPMIACDDDDGIPAHHVM